MNLRIFSLLFFIGSFYSLIAQPTESNFRSINMFVATAEPEPSVTIPTYTDQELENRLSQITSQVVSPRLTPVVKSYIKTYTVLKREKTEGMLGRSATYFPLIEKHMLEAEMPVDLKYLAVVESALNPQAVSRSRAVGMWQFMSPTGRENGLKINSLVDERKDPNKATEAAIKYLKFLFRKYDNWELALAAYNGGPGRVNRAIRRGRSKNFWKIKRFLPRETRAYVPAFIAATYIMNFYEAHNLSPDYPEIDKQLIETVKIYDRISFQMISEISGTPMHLIKELNPSYKQHFLPTNSRGNYLILPARYMPAIKAHFNIPDHRPPMLSGGAIHVPKLKAMPPPEGFIAHDYTVQNGDRLENLSRTFQCTEDQLIGWNMLRDPHLRPGQRLRIYLAPRRKELTKPLDQLPKKQVILIESQQLNNSLPINMVNLEQNYFKYMEEQLKKENGFFYYQIRRRESLTDIVRKFPSTSIPKILRLNDIKNSRQLKTGKWIKISAAK